MGFLSNIGKGLKQVAKVVSIKNAVNVVTGNGGAVVKDAVDRVKQAGSIVVSGAVNSVKNDVKKLTDNVVSGGFKGATVGSLVPSLSVPRLTKAQLVKTPASVQFDLATKKVAGIEETLIDYAGGKLNELVEKEKQKVYAKPQVKSVMDFFKKEVTGYYWQEYKTRIILGASVLVGGLVWYFKFRKPKHGRRRQK